MSLHLLSNRRKRNVATEISSSFDENDDADELNNNDDDDDGMLLFLCLVWDHNYLLFTCSWTVTWKFILIYQILFITTTLSPFIVATPLLTDFKEVRQTRSRRGESTGSKTSEDQQVQGATQAVESFFADCLPQSKGTLTYASKLRSLHVDKFINFQTEFTRVAKNWSPWFAWVRNNKLSFVCELVRRGYLEAGVGVKKGKYKILLAG